MGTISDWTPEQTERFHEILGKENATLENLTREEAVFILDGTTDSHYEDLDTELRHFQENLAAQDRRLGMTSLEAV